MLHRLKLPLAIALIYCRISSALIDLGVGLKIGIFIQFSLSSLLILSLRITFNESWIVATLGHGVGVFAPGRSSDRTRSPEGDSSTEPWL